MSEQKVVIGSGGYNNNPGWLHTEEADLDIISADSWKNQFKEQSISALLAEHVWEHLTYEEGEKAAKLAFRYLKPGGHIRIAVPDGFFQNEEYQSMVQVGGPGPEDHPAFSHKIVYNYDSLRRLFVDAGFRVNLLEYFDEQGVFHHEPWHAEDGVIFRSLTIDPRNQGESPVFPSLILDAIKQ